MVPASTWCPTRFVFSRVPFGVGNRNGHQSLANDDLELRPDQHGDMFGDGLTALVALVFLDAGATRIFIRFGLDFIPMVRTRGGATFKKRRGLRSSTGGVKLKDTGACINLDHEDEEHIDGGSKMIDDDTNRDKDACIEKGLKKKAITKKKKPSNIENAIPLSTVMEGKKGNESSSSHAIVLPAKKRKLDENEGLKVKKVKANKDKNIVIHRQESAIIDSDVHMPFHLVEMIKTFSDDQIKAVKEIGFGGLLSLKVKRTATDMLSWLVDCFDHGSCMFTIDGKKDFVVTEFDVYDVFCLPCKTSKKVEEISRCANVINPDYDLKVKWRSHFGLMGENDQIPLGFLESKIPLLVDGGEEFRHLFIMHAFSSFLAPTSNRTVDLRIVKCLVDVNQIRIYNWSKYVLDRLCEAVKSYKEGNIEWFCGCVLMLEIIYFHRLRFRNVVLNSTIPLIQHWTDVDIRDRIRNEKLSKGFGCGILEFDTYPVSEKLQFEDGQVVCNQFKEAPVNQTSGKESVVYEGVRSNVKGVIQFELPASSMSNEEIRSIAIDDIRNGSRSMRPVPSISLFPQSIRSAPSKIQTSHGSGSPISVNSNGSVMEVHILMGCLRTGRKKGLFGRLTGADMYESTRYDAILLKEDLKNTTWLHSVDDMSDQCSVFENSLCQNHLASHDWFLISVFYIYPIFQIDYIKSYMIISA
uniref:Uncharacterized protein n=1 Tax=Chenopodium quinoa TaxID=63459 RepID=A0A803MVN9_CHEQI